MADMNRSGGVLYGMLITALILSAATAVSLACLGRAAKLSRDAYAQDAGAAYVQTIADMMAADGGCLDEAAKTVGAEPHAGCFTVFFDTDMALCEEDAARYAISAETGTAQGMFGSGTVELYDTDSGNVLVRVPVGWTCTDIETDENGGGSHE